MFSDIRVIPKIMVDVIAIGLHLFLRVGVKEISSSFHFVIRGFQSVHKIDILISQD